MKIKKTCEKCGKECNELRDFKCYRCYIKNRKIINPKIPYTLERAISKEYVVKGYLDKDSSILAVIDVPSILAGFKVKLVLLGQMKISNELKKLLKRTYKFKYGFEESLSREYVCNGNFKTKIFAPSILVGHKIKLEIVSPGY